MKEIRAVGQPFFLLKVIERLRAMKQPISVTVSEILDFGALPMERTSQSDGDFVKKWRLEVIVADLEYEAILKIIRDCAQSESSTQTQIFVSQIEDMSDHLAPS